MVAQAVGGKEHLLPQTLYHTALLSVLRILDQGEENGESEYGQSPALLAVLLPPSDRMWTDMR
jgi:hypothetical protein